MIVNSEEMLGYDPDRCPLDLLEYRGCSQARSTKQIETTNKNLDINLQNTIREINFIGYMTGTASENISSQRVIELVNAVQLPPVRLRDKVQTYNTEPRKLSFNIASIVTKWLADCMNKPHQFAEAVFSYFSTKTQYLHYFCTVTFPSIFKNFSYSDYHIMAYKFIIELMKISDFQFYSEFVFSFITSNNLFFTILWRKFDQFISSETPQVAHADTLTIFIKAFGIALTMLSKQQQELLQRVADINKEQFGYTFFAKRLAASYINSHKHSLYNFEKHPTVQLLKFIGANTNTPHFDYLLSKIKNIPSSQLVMAQSYTFSGNLCSIVVSLHDLLLIQNVVVKSSDLSMALNKNLLISDDFAWVVEPLIIDFTTDAVSQETNDGSLTNSFLSLKSDAEVEGTEQNRRDWKKACLLAKKDRLGLTDPSAISRRLRKVRRRIPSWADPQFVSYATSQCVKEASEDIINFERAMGQLTAQNSLLRQIDLATTILRTVIQDVGARVFEDFGRQSFVSVHSQTFMRIERVYCNAMLQLKEPQELKVKRSVRIFQFPAPQRKAMELRRKLSMCGADMNIPRLESPQRLTAEYIDEISGQCTTPELRLSVLLSGIDMLTVKPPAVASVRTRYNHALDVLRMNARVALMRGFDPLRASSPKSVVPQMAAEVDPFVRSIARNIDLLFNVRKGFEIMVVSTFGNQLLDLCREFVADEPGARLALFRGCVTLSVTDCLFTSFVSAQTILARHPAIRGLMSPRVKEGFEFIESMYWAFLDSMDVSLAEDIKLAIKVDEAAA